MKNSPTHLFVKCGICAMMNNGGVCVCRETTASFLLVYTLNTTKILIHSSKDLTKEHFFLDKHQPCSNTVPTLIQTCTNSAPPCSNPVLILVQHSNDPSPILCQPYSNREPTLLQLRANRASTLPRPSSNRVNWVELQAKITVTAGNYKLSDKRIDTVPWEALHFHHQNPWIRS